MPVYFNIIYTQEAHQFLSEFSKAKASKASGQCLCLLFAEVCNWRTTLSIESSLSWVS